METIFALTTGLEKASLGLVRLSGRRAFELGRACCSLPPEKALQDRYLYRTRFRHPETRQNLDDGLICFFSAPRSYTGEDVVELHLHASRAVLKNLFDYFESQDDVRMAEPGEYTKRAVLAGKMGLLEAEAVLDLVRAETNVQLLFAQKKKTGRALERRGNMARDPLGGGRPIGRNNRISRRRPRKPLRGAEDP